MNISFTNQIPHILRFSWLTGPLFDKELRVSSRRRRNYILRSVYVALLTVFVVMVWLSVVKYGASGAYQRSRMAVAGKTITSTIIMFQFAATQLIAIVMLSTAISDEIYHRTLGLLMTTPINSFQIVVGKLFSKLLQLILLLAISLPLLAIVRVLGGVPWNYVLSSLCITLTAVIFAGLLSMHFSIHNRRAYVVIIKTIFVLGVLYVFIPAMIGSLAITPMSRMPVFRTLWPWILRFNPVGAMSSNTSLMMSPRARFASPSSYWPLHCGIMLAMSALLLAWSVTVVRKVALRQATGQLDFASRHRRRRSRTKSLLRTGASEESAGPIRRVKGTPVLWKELRAPTIRGPDRRNSIIGLVCTIGAMLFTYAMFDRVKCLNQDFTHVTYTLLFIVIGLIVNTVLSSTCITVEKESHAWPILLTTSMDDWQILIGKALAVFRRCLPIWLLLASHVVLFVLVRYINPIAIVHLFMLMTWLLVFVTGSGLYFSACFKRTTSAVVANFALALVLWAIAPALFGLVATITRDQDPAQACLCANPMVQAAVIMYGASGEHNAYARLSGLEYNWPYDKLTVGLTTVILLIVMFMYTSVGLLFAWRAKCRFRRNIF